MKKTKNPFLGHEVWALSSLPFKNGVPGRKRGCLLLNKLLRSNLHLMERPLEH
jgi:hypothetical protein